MGIRLRLETEILCGFVPSRSVYHNGTDYCAYNVKNSECWSHSQILLKFQEDFCGPHEESARSSPLAGDEVSDDSKNRHSIIEAVIRK